MHFPSKAFLATTITFFVLPVAVCAQTASVNAPAPNFTATDSQGQTHSLDKYRGNYVVLEWHNQGCPFPRKHSESGHMQNLQQECTSKGVVWFTVIPSE